MVWLAVRTNWAPFGARRPRAATRPPPERRRGAGSPVEPPAPARTARPQARLGGRARPATTAPAQLGPLRGPGSQRRLRRRPPPPTPRIAAPPRPLARPSTVPRTRRRPDDGVRRPWVVLRWGCGLVWTVRWGPPYTPPIGRGGAVGDGSARPCSRRAPGAGARAVLGAAWTVAPGPPIAGAQQSLIDSDPAVVKARADLEAAQAAAHDAAAKLEATTEQRDAVEGEDRRRPDPHRRARSAARRPRAPPRQPCSTTCGERAVALYSMGSDGTSATDMFSGQRRSTARAASSSATPRTAADHDNAVRLEDARTTLAATQASLRQRAGRPRAAAGRPRRPASPTSSSSRPRSSSGSRRRTPRSSGPGCSARCMPPASRSWVRRRSPPTRWWPGSTRRDTGPGSTASASASSRRSSSRRAATRMCAATSPSRRRSSRRVGSRPRPTTTTRASAGATPARAARCSPHHATASAPRSSCCSTTPTRTHAPPAHTIRRRRTGGSPIPTPRSAPSTPTSPRAGPPRGATWATATGRPTRATPAR